MHEKLKPTSKSDRYITWKIWASQENNSCLELQNKSSPSNTLLGNPKHCKRKKYSYPVRDTYYLVTLFSIEHTSCISIFTNIIYNTNVWTYNVNYSICVNNSNMYISFTRFPFYLFFLPFYPRLYTKFNVTADMVLVQPSGLPYFHYLLPTISRVLFSLFFSPSENKKIKNKSINYEEEDKVKRIK